MTKLHQNVVYLFAIFNGKVITPNLGNCQADTPISVDVILSQSCLLHNGVHIVSSLVLGEVVQLLLNVIHNNGTAGIFIIAKFVPLIYLCDLASIFIYQCKCTNGLGKAKASKTVLSLIGNSANFYACVNM